MLTFSFASSMDKIRTEKFVYVCFGERADAFPCSPPQQSPKILEGIFGIRQAYIASKSHPPHTEQESQKLSNDERTSADVEHACSPSFKLIEFNQRSFLKSPPRKNWFPSSALNESKNSPRQPWCWCEATAKIDNFFLSTYMFIQDSNCSARLPSPTKSRVGKRKSVCEEKFHFVCFWIPQCFCFSANEIANLSMKLCNYVSWIFFVFGIESDLVISQKLWTCRAVFAQKEKV